MRLRIMLRWTAFLKLYFGTPIRTWTGDGPSNDACIQVPRNGLRWIVEPSANNLLISRWLPSRSSLENVCLMVQPDLPEHIFQGMKMPKCMYYFFLDSLWRKRSIAMVIDAAVCVGASTLRVSPASLTALWVVLPKAPMAVSPWTKSG